MVLLQLLFAICCEVQHKQLGTHTLEYSSLLMFTILLLTAAAVDYQSVKKAMKKYPVVDICAKVKQC